MKCRKCKTEIKNNEFHRIIFEVLEPAKNGVMRICEIPLIVCYQCFDFMQFIMNEEPFVHQRITYTELIGK